VGGQSFWEGNGAVRQIELSFRRSKRTLKMETKKYRRSCGIDVHKKNVTVCILPPIGRMEVEVRMRTFRTFTRDLKQLRTWLKNCKVTERSANLIEKLAAY
jgi:hypothetical protein